MYMTAFIDKCSYCQTTVTKMASRRRSATVHITILAMSCMIILSFISGVEAKRRNHCDRGGCGGGGGGGGGRGGGGGGRGGGVGGGGGGMVDGGNRGGGARGGGQYA